MSRPPLNGGEGDLCLKPRSDPGASSRRLLHSGVNACSSPPPQKLLRRLAGNGSWGRVLCRASPGIPAYQVAARPRAAVSHASFHQSRHLNLESRQARPFVACPPPLRNEKVVHRSVIFCICGGNTTRPSHMTSYAESVCGDVAASASDVISLCSWQCEVHDRTPGPDKSPSRSLARSFSSVLSSVSRPTTHSLPSCCFVLHCGCCCPCPLRPSSSAAVAAVAAAFVWPPTVPPSPPCRRRPRRPYRSLARSPGRWM